MHLVFINRCYWPDAEATGQLLTELCETLALEHRVTVIAGQPNAKVEPDGDAFTEEGEQVRNRVRIIRTKHWQLAKGKIVGRLINYASFTRSAMQALKALSKPDLIVCETDPFLLSLAVSRYTQRLGLPYVAYLQDIYPDVAVAVGVTRDSALIRGLRNKLKQAYAAAERVIVLSDSMAQKILDWGLPREKIAVIPNWIDCEQVYPCELPNPMRSEFDVSHEHCLVMHSGNMGATQPLEPLVSAIHHPNCPAEVKLAMVGGGVRKAALQAFVKGFPGERIRFYPYQPRNRLGQSLSAADIQVIASDPRVDGCLAPSKLYGILATGRPSLVIGSAESDAAKLVLGYGIGEVVSPDPGAIAAGIRKLWEAPSQRQAMSEKARNLAVSEFDKRIVIPKLKACFEEAAYKKATHSSLH